MGGKQIQSSLIASSQPLQQLFNTQKKTNPTISVLLAKFTSLIKFQKQFCIHNNKKQQIWLTKLIVSLFYHPSFYEQAVYWYSFLKNYIIKQANKKTMLLISSDQWRMCLGLSQFVMICCDEKLHQLFNQKQSMKIPKQNSEQGQDVQKIYNRTTKLQSIQNKLTKQQIKQVRNKFRQFIYYSLLIKNKVVSNFSVSFTLINRTVECLLNLYIKLQYEQPEIDGLKRNITICAYTIGLGIEYFNPCLINLSVKFLKRVLQACQQNAQVITNLKLNPIPAAYFKQILVLNCKSLQETIICYLLFILIKRPQNVNLHAVGKLVQLIIRIYRPVNNQINKFIDKLCDFLNYSQKQQLILYKIIEQYCKINTKQTIKMQRFMQKHQKFVFDKQIDIAQQRKTEPDKSKSQQAEIPKITNNINSQADIQLVILYHEIVTKRFLPNVSIQLNTKMNQSIQFFNQIKSQQNIQIFEDNKNSEDDSLQRITVTEQIKPNRRKNKGFYIEQIN